MISPFEVTTLGELPRTQYPMQTLTLGGGGMDALAGTIMLGGLAVLGAGAVGGYYLGHRTVWPGAVAGVGATVGLLFLYMLSRRN